MPNPAHSQWVHNVFISANVLSILTHAVDIEEALYKHAAAMGITLLTITQVRNLCCGQSAQFICCCSSSCCHCGVLLGMLLHRSGLLLLTSNHCFLLYLQRTALVQYHHFELRLTDGKGSWELREIHESRRAPGAGAAKKKKVPNV